MLAAAHDPKWKQAMKTEIEAVEKNNTWKLVELTTNQREIGLKWVYKMKKDTQGKIIKYKARIVAKGYVQKQGKEFEEIFASVTRLENGQTLVGTCC